LLFIKNIDKTISENNPNTKHRDFLNIFDELFSKLDFEMMCDHVFFYKHLN